ncbi:Methyl-accepting chemotaxis protein PctC [Photobacterium damselae subsp. piscicida]|uniref:Methyl-accepting chemotaxis protein n=2 Tax=Photobacterium damselae TaxID=38293 RepID=A0A1V1V5S6_PHODP|nr:methyl-accepting chemotaxis protein [Photobacterium damselae]MBE8128335.1 methyl-accepting chemotaxis protein [Photobacterium damselae subsp. piscicida]PSV78729.1 methyl-accepting chemotaxis protein [Photobacterium damselae]PSW82863.1 methyl-accepting chemotaxis protein [Photobacterium damselae]QOD53049.1 methyl-accepting chemotaxis protein [Photobacterium damselae subsp. piscicida]QOD56889.1 methyl-accepting chemotaxis protein [Photobacterium damselae subsp. piscicida]
MNLNHLSIKKKLILAMISAVLFSTTLVGILSQQQARKIIETRLLEPEIPATLLQIRNQIDKEVSLLQAAAQQLATNPLVIDSLTATLPQDNTQIVTLLNEIKQQYHLFDASIADRNTGNYWNQDGFLRQLNHQQDSWFYNFVRSGNAKMLNVFREANGDVKLFVNYQQLNGKGLAGLSKSLDEMVQFINQFKLEQTGFVYLVDDKGIVRIHHDNQLMGKASLTDLYGSKVANQLLKRGKVEIADLDLAGQENLVASSYIPTMNWYVIAQLPKHEAFASLNHARNQILIWTVIIALGFTALAIWLASSITHPIARLAEMFKDLGEGEGDLRHRLDIQGNDEIAQLSQGFNGFISKIHNSVKEVAETGNALRHASQSVAEQAQTTLDNSQSQRYRTIQVVTAINEMGATVNEIAGNAAQAADATHLAETEAQSGQQVVGQARETISQLSHDVAQVSEVIESLTHNTQAIGSILDVIRGISEQTNLLALNAAIEAARAGEQGRGFAVVADEVRSLASRTAASTDEIQTMINRLQQEASNAVAAIEQSRLLSSNGVSASDEASSALISIAERITLIADMNTQVATATEEQSTVVNDINCNIEEINETTQRTATTAEDLAQASLELQQLSHRLEVMVGSFKL